MKALTVKQLAAISGVTVRTLHHYDQIGLLQPSRVGANGYRYYGRDELLRLQRILFHRELGVPLAAIAELLELEGQDQVSVLKQHRDKLVAERERYWTLIQTIDLTVAELQGEGNMNNADLYKGFSPEKQAGYEAWLIERYGEPMRQSLDISRQSYAKMSPAQRDALGKELHEVEQSLVNSMHDGIEAASDQVDALIHRHRAWVSSMWGAPCRVERYAGLADLYLAHPDFLARYEDIAVGFARYLTDAMKIHARRWSGGSGSSTD